MSAAIPMDKVKEQKEIRVSESQSKSQDGGYKKHIIVLGIISFLMGLVGFYVNMIKGDVISSMNDKTESMKGYFDSETENMKTYLNGEIKNVKDIMEEKIKHTEENMRNSLDKHSSLIQKDISFFKDAHQHSITDISKLNERVKGVETTLIYQTELLREMREDLKSLRNSRSP